MKKLLLFLSLCVLFSVAVNTRCDNQKVQVCVCKESWETNPAGNPLEAFCLYMSRLPEQDYGYSYKLCMEGETCPSNNCCPHGATGFCETVASTPTPSPTPGAGLFLPKEWFAEQGFTRFSKGRGSFTLSVPTFGSIDVEPVDSGDVMPYDEYGNSMIRRFFETGTEVVRISTSSGEMTYVGVDFTSAKDGIFVHSITLLWTRDPSALRPQGVLNFLAEQGLLEVE
ncbi:MAG: hypothetical protein CEN90_282 [Parcubacteria group bacterium Licking1014_17]|nr:MAG: hypothetical protein CEN90_282 [Parcubacteria group bacterium Licking1014_17]